MAALTDRLCEKGRFRRSLDFLMARVPSTFGFFDGFAAYLAHRDGRELSKISQRELFSHVAAFGKGLLAADEADALASCLQADFSDFEVRKPPKF